MADVQSSLDELVDLVEDAKQSFLSSSMCKIDRRELLGALDFLRELLPAELVEARGLLAERQHLLESGQAQAAEVVARARAEADHIRTQATEEARRTAEQGRREADRVLAAAQDERELLVRAEYVLIEADRRAERVLEGVREESRRTRAEIEDWADGRLAQFEMALNRTLDQVRRGRERLRGPSEVVLDDPAPYGVT